MVLFRQLEKDGNFKVILSFLRVLFKMGVLILM